MEPDRENITSPPGATTTTKSVFHPPFFPPCLTCTAFTCLSVWFAPCALVCTSTSLVACHFSLLHNYNHFSFLVIFLNSDFVSFWSCPSNVLRLWTFFFYTYFSTLTSLSLSYYPVQLQRKQVQKRNPYILLLNDTLQLQGHSRPESI